LEIENDSYHTSVLVRNVHIVLILEIIVDRVKNRFKLKGATHQIEQEGQEEVSDIIIK